MRIICIEVGSLCRFSALLIIHFSDWNQAGLMLLRVKMCHMMSFDASLHDRLLARVLFTLASSVEHLCRQLL